jgi:hypothetical protein
VIGVHGRITKSGIPVLRLHYSAAESKRPGTPVGDEWLAGAIQGYVGGLDSPRWRKEMEIEYQAMQGTSLFPLWSQWVHHGKLVIPSFEPHGYRLYGSYDHGYRHPACYLVHGINAEGEIVTLWEAYHANVTVTDWKKIINGQTVKLLDGRTLPGCPFPRESLAWIVADPSIWAEDKPMSDNTNKSTAWLFLQTPFPVFFTKGERGGDMTVAEWLLGDYWADPERPRWRITKECPNLIREIGLQRHKQISEQQALNNAQPEELVDKDNDSWDSFKYFAQKFPPSAAKPMVATRPNTFEWWRAQVKAAASGKALGTFKVGEQATIKSYQRQSMDDDT